MEKKVSIILPTYNGEKRIKEAIESVLSQTYENIELIIVNDCSTDGTLEVLKQFEKIDSRVVVVSNEVNKKLPASLNIGFQYATGEYLTWTSDDNRYHEEAIETMVHVLDSSNETDLVYCDYNIVDLDGNYITTLYKEEPDSLKYVNCVGACFLYRKTITEKVGEYNSNFFLAEDYEYWLRIYLNGKMKHLPKVLYDYSIHEASLTSTRQKEILRKTYEVKNLYYDELRVRCKTQPDIDKFYWSMLLLLEGTPEEKEIKRKYYRENHVFAIHDIQKNISQKCKYPLIVAKACLKKMVQKNK